MGPSDAKAAKYAAVSSVVLLVLVFAVTAVLFPRIAVPPDPDIAGLQGGPTSTPATPQPGVAVIVNGDHVYTTTIAVSQAYILQYESTEDDPITEEQACLMAVDRAVGSVVLNQEAVDRGITASATEAVQAVETLLASATDEPIYAGFLDEQQDRLGVSDEEYAEGLRALAEVQLVEAKARGQIADEAPTPAATEVEGHLAANKQNHLVIMALPFDDSVSANQAYEALFDVLLESHEPGSFAEQFIAYGKQLGIYEQDAIDVSEGFDYSDPEDLPDYAWGASQTAEGGISMLSREDDTAVVYYVLVNTQADAANLEDNVLESLTQQKRYEHAESEIDALVQAAQAQVLIDCSDFP